MISDSACVGGNDARGAKIKMTHSTLEAAIAAVRENPTSRHGFANHASVDVVTLPAWQVPGHAERKKQAGATAIAALKDAGFAKIGGKWKKDGIEAIATINDFASTITVNVDGQWVAVEPAVLPSFDRPQV